MREILRLFEKIEEEWGISSKYLSLDWAYQFIQSQTPRLSPNSRLQDKTPTLNLQPQTSPQAPSNFFIETQ